jgi:formate hydrogenlyase subunit 6/NADH:ubiquinone oxidoreductase subunit I
MYCGICIEVCPFDALFWSPEHDYAGPDLRSLLQERDALGTWLRSAPDAPERTPGDVR